MTQGIVAILLAAGESTRMGRPKPLLPWGDTTLLEWQVHQLVAAGAERVVVVLGHNAAELEALVRSAGAEPVVNVDYASGRASSLRCGAMAIPAAAAVVVLSVDQPRPAWLTSLLIEEWAVAPTKIVLPESGGHRGHPVVLDGSLLDELRAVDDDSLGLRAVIDRHSEETRTVPVANSVVIVDLNTPEDYATALEAFNRRDWSKR